MNILMFYVFILITLPITFGIDFTKCPTPKSIMPCSCVKIYTLSRGWNAVIRCTNIRNLIDLKGAFSISEDIPFVITLLSNSSVLYYPTSSLATRRTEKLIIMDTTLVSIFDAPPPISNRLKFVRLYKVKVLHGMNWQLFSTLQRPFDLMISEVDIRKIGNSFGQQMSKKIHSVSFSRTKTFKLGSSAFAPLKNISSIIVTGSNVRIIERSMFPRPYTGYNLEFSYNKIETLPSDLFTDMPSVGKIVLAGNLLTTLSQSVFGSLGSNVRQVFIGDNPIICDCQIRWIVNKKFPLFYIGTCTGNNWNSGKYTHVLGVQDFKNC